MHPSDPPLRIVQATLPSALGPPRLQVMCLAREAAPHVLERLRDLKTRGVDVLGVLDGEPPAPPLGAAPPAQHIGIEYAPNGVQVVSVPTAIVTATHLGRACSEAHPALTAWDRALALAVLRGQDVWFIEDDVDWADTDAFVRELRRHDEIALRENAALAARDFFDSRSRPDWYHWQTRDPTAPALWRSFNPVCRLSKTLLLKIRENAAMAASGDPTAVPRFHEILFAQLAFKHSLPVNELSTAALCVLYRLVFVEEQL